MTNSWADFFQMGLVGPSLRGVKVRKMTKLLFNKSLQSHCKDSSKIKYNDKIFLQSFLLGDKFLADAKHGGEENAMFLQPVDISLPGNGGTSKRPGENESQLYATTCACCLLLFLVTWHPKT